jgi:hypothetical protein
MYFHSIFDYSALILSPKLTTISLTLLLTLTNPDNLSPVYSALTFTRKSSSKLLQNLPNLVYAYILTHTILDLAWFSSTDLAFNAFSKKATNLLGSLIYIFYTWDLYWLLFCFPIHIWPTISWNYQDQWMQDV